MESIYGFDPETGITTVPCIGIIVDGQEVECSWLNTTVCTFKQTEYDHIEWIDEEGVAWGISVTIDTINDFLEHDFPHRFEPLVNEAAQSWMGNILLREMES
jgi:hypothetical protein